MTFSINASWRSCCVASMAPRTYGRAASCKAARRSPSSSGLTHPTGRGLLLGAQPTAAPAPAGTQLCSPRGPPEPPPVRVHPGFRSAPKTAHPLYLQPRHLPEIWVHRSLFPWTSPGRHLSDDSAFPKEKLGYPSKAASPQRPPP